MELKLRDSGLKLINFIILQKSLSALAYVNIKILTYIYSKSYEITCGGCKRACIVWKWGYPNQPKVNIWQNRYDYCILYHSNLESKINTWKESKSRTFSNEIISSKKLNTGTNAKQANFYALRPKIKQLEIDHEFTAQPVSFLLYW